MKAHMMLPWPHKKPGLFLAHDDDDNTTTNQLQNQSLVQENRSPFVPLLLASSAVLKISYNGEFFHGWSAANDGAKDACSIIQQPLDKELNVQTSRRRRRRRKGLRIPGAGVQIRSVQGILKNTLAKIYGNVDPNRIQVEGCSRTDKGVHAQGMIALIHCWKDLSFPNTPETNSHTSTTIPEKRTTYLCSPNNYDSLYFEPLPFHSNLNKLVFVLNRMLPPDVRVQEASFNPSASFHPTLDAVSKTYQYTFSIGKMYDPLRRRSVWHVDNSAAMSFDLENACHAAHAFVGTHDFVSFRGAFRGSDRGRIQDTVCTLFEVKVERETNDNASDGNLQPSFQDIIGEETYVVTITGDRFLYKMVRCLVGIIVGAGLRKVNTRDVTNTLLTSVDDESSDDSKAKEKELKRTQRTFAPAHGLVLKKVHYKDNVKFVWHRSS